MTVPEQEQLDNADILLSTAVEALGFDKGDLLTAAKQPDPQNQGEWLERGDWLTLGKSVGAEQIFFVDHYPVVVFAKINDHDELTLRTLYNRIWCMARPQLLFLARPGELAVYDLSRPPIRPGEPIQDRGRQISAIVNKAAEIQAKLAQFRREEIESGRLFGDSRFADGTHRADRALIRDLRTVRQKLLQEGLGARYAHALIGRSIFIRYLEDREVLVPEYFEHVAAKRKHWSSLLGAPPQRPLAEPTLQNLLYPRVLADKDLTYALFEQLAEDFNGDIFPVDEDEKKKVKADHLELLQGLLLGDTQEQQQLFFFAYRFDIIPIELISSIYEEFYNEEQGKDKNHGSHYTPAALVDFVLSRTLTTAILDKAPRVLDPACGSGIFLVESFRRMVRHQIRKQDGRRISRPQLRRILRDQIAGIDINEEATRVAAFSLYLAFLHYQEPREINEERRLPNLKCIRRNSKDDDQHFDILLHGNAFDAVGGSLGADFQRKFGPAAADVVVGNPPWGYPKRTDHLGHAALARALKWCEEQKCIIGDKELSQAFVHLALTVLKPQGRAGLLVSSGVFFKHHPKSRQFRQQWLTSARLEHVVNFAQVRHIFFRGEARRSEAIAPFAAAIFENDIAGPDDRFGYWSAKRTELVETAQAVILSKADMHWLSQWDCLKDEHLWKIYWWGGHRDEALIRSLGRFERLMDLPKTLPGTNVLADIGFVEGKTGKKPSGWLQSFKELPIDAFERYGPLPVNRLRDVPSSVRRRGTREAYEGHRLLVRRGIPATGKLTVRLENRSFSFKHSIFAFRLKGFEDWQEAVLLGIFWSSLARYYIFLTTGSWGMWHDELNMEIAGSMPIAFPEDRSLRMNIVGTVEKLQSFKINSTALEDPAVQQQINALELELDNSIFDLYGLNGAERDLVRDMCDIGLDFLYQSRSSIAVKPISLPDQGYGANADVADAESGVQAYLKAFLQSWSTGLSSELELAWHILSPSSQSTLLAVLFSTQLKDGSHLGPIHSNGTTWASVLATLDKYSRQTAGSRRIYIDSFVRLVLEDSILLVKRNELRFWTRSAAREDAEATQLQLVHLQESRA